MQTALDRPIDTIQTDEDWETIRAKIESRMRHAFPGSHCDIDDATQDIVTILGIRMVDGEFDEDERPARMVIASEDAIRSLQRRDTWTEDGKQYEQRQPPVYRPLLSEPTQLADIIADDMDGLNQPRDMYGLSRAECIDAGLYPIADIRTTIGTDR